MANHTCADVTGRIVGDCLWVCEHALGHFTAAVQFAWPTTNLINWWVCCSCVDQQHLGHQKWHPLGLLHAACVNGGCSCEASTLLKMQTSQCPLLGICEGVQQFCGPCFVWIAGHASTLSCHAAQPLLACHYHHQVCTTPSGPSSPPISCLWNA